MKKWRRIKHNEATRKLGAETQAKVRAEELFDALAAEFVYLARHNPRVSKMVRRGNEIARKFTTADLLVYLYPFLFSPELGARKILDRCSSLDKNFARNFNKFNKLCGNESQLNPRHDKPMKTVLCSPPIEFVTTGL